MDTINKFTIVELCKEHNYHQFEKIYWLQPGKDLDISLRLLDKDRHVVEMCSATMRANGEIDVFSTHPVEVGPIFAKLEPPIIECDATMETQPKCKSFRDESSKEKTVASGSTKGKGKIVVASGKKKVASVAGKGKKVDSRKCKGKVVGESRKKKVTSEAGKRNKVDLRQGKGKVGVGSNNKRNRVEQEHVQSESEDTWTDEVESEHDDEEVGGVVRQRQDYASSARGGVNALGTVTHYDLDDDERIRFVILNEQ
ncbi:hypothetical protein SESBI_29891 [Sesbania bispinosa]|nr:hypothetical protein SESBI_29891 [Sesbania bispinosa]